MCVCTCTQMTCAVAVAWAAMAGAADRVVAGSMAAVAADWAVAGWDLEGEEALAGEKG